MMSVGVNCDGITSEIKAVLLVDFIKKLGKALAVKASKLLLFR